jgi:lipopolysaccharide export system permease protein
MTILDRYIAKELFFPFIFGILAFTFILSGSTILFALIGEAIKYNIPFWHFLQLFLFKLPQVIALSFPMSMLLATILAFGRLGNDLEILALRASGISVLRLVVPVVIIGLLVSSMTVWFNESIVPNASRSAEDLFRSYRDSDKPTVKQNINLTEYKKGLPSRIINVQEVDEGLLKNVTVAEYDEGKLIRLVRAKNGIFVKEGGWKFFNGVMHNFNILNPKQVTVIEFKTEFINLRLEPVDLNKRKKKMEEMNRKELKARIDTKKEQGEDVTKDVMDYHMKLSVAFASLIYSILGASVGLRPHRSSSALGLGLSLLIILAYIVLLSIGMGLGISGTLPPILAAWFPNIIVGFVGLNLLNKVSST